MPHNDESFTSMFLGPKAENRSVLIDLSLEVILDAIDRRRQFHPADGAVFDEAVRSQPGYQQRTDRLRGAVDELLDRLGESIPWFSPRYMAHMNTDVLIPAVVGYLATMLHNPNNVVFESSPATSQMEVEAIDELLNLVGFIPRHLKSASQTWGWGHFTSGGHIANFEALWVARNLKYFPLALQYCADQEVNVPIHLPNGESRRLFEEFGAPNQSRREQNRWELLNLTNTEALSLRQRLIDEMKRQYLAGELIRFPLAEDGRKQHADMRQIERVVDESFVKHSGVSSQGLWGKWYSDQPGKIFTSGTAHYSIAKAAEVLGIGRNQLVKVPVDKHFRMDVGMLRNELLKCSKNREPVIAVVAIMGSTEEGAIDPLHEICDLRDEFARTEGLYFPIHVDAAYGGYLRTMFVDKDGNDLEQHQVMMSVGYSYPSRLVFRAQEALRRVESITIDPHKKGYIPYPAGAILFADSRIRDIVSTKAPYLWHGGQETVETDVYIGPYTLEGSRPGAAAAAVWMAQKVLPLHVEGHGQLIAGSVRNAQELYRQLTEMNPIDLGQHSSVVQLIPICQPDSSIVCFTLNILGNRRLRIMNELVEKVYQRFSCTDRPPESPRDDFFVSMTELGWDEYGESIHGVLFEDSHIQPGDYNEENQQSEEQRPGNHMKVIRMTMMHPWSLVRSGDGGLDYIRLFCQELVVALRTIVPQIKLEEVTEYTER